MDKIWQKRMDGLKRFISRAVEPLSKPQDGDVELSLIKRRQEVARSKRMAMEMTSSRPRVHSPSRSPPLRRQSAHHRIETDVDGGTTRDNVGEGRLSVTSKTRIDPIRVDLPMTTRSSNRLGTRSANTRIIYRQSPSASPVVEKFSALHGLGKPWDAPVVYPFDGERKTQTSVEHRDLERLDEGEFLNDNLIAFYLK